MLMIMSINFNQFIYKQKQTYFSKERIWMNHPGAFNVKKSLLFKTILSACLILEKTIVFIAFCKPFSNLFNKNEYFLETITAFV